MCPPCGAGGKPSRATLALLHVSDIVQDVAWSREFRSLLEGFASLRLLPEWVVDAVMAGFLVWTWVDPFWTEPSAPQDLQPMLLFKFFAIFTLRSAWHAFWWHMARTGRLEASASP